MVKPDKVANKAEKPSPLEKIRLTDLRDKGMASGLNSAEFTEFLHLHNKHEGKAKG